MEGYSPRVEFFDEDPYDEEWYYCLDHKAVEPEEGCRAEVRIGPFPTKEKAAAALETVEERNLDWESDPNWNDDLD